MTLITVFLATALLGLIAALGVFLGCMRAGWSPVIDRVRRMNSRYLNPRETETAGSPVLPHAEVADAFTSSDRAMGKLLGTSSCLRLRHVRTDAPLIGVSART